MGPDPLPPDLRHLERHLARRPRPEPEAGLRARVLAAARAERGSPAWRRSERAWGLAAWAAAAALLALNLAMCAANGVRYRSLPVQAPELAGIAPGRAEVRPATDPWPLAASAVARLAPAPDAGNVVRLFFEQKGS
jgi:hypothetical protein